MKNIVVTHEIVNENQVEPCQLHKVSNRPCSIICAFENKYPVYYVDEHEQPLILGKDNYI